MDREEGGSWFEQEGGSGYEPKEAWQGGWAGGAGPSLDGGKATNTEGAAGEEDELGWASQANKRAASNGSGVWEWEGCAEPGYVCVVCLLLLCLVDKEDLLFLCLCFWVCNFWILILCSSI